MMLTVNVDGAEVLLNFLNRVHIGSHITESEKQSVLAANKFFVDYYCQWDGVTQENLSAAMYNFAQPQWSPSVRVLDALSQGFRQAVNDINMLKGKLDFLQNIDTTTLTDRVVPYLPPDTPLQSTIHITIDSFNGGFQYQGEMGLSVLKDITNPERFETFVAHELHHVGFSYWAERDLIRLALLREHSCRGVAVRHVQNLLSEGLAIFYCSPFPSQDETSAIAESTLVQHQAKLAKYRREELTLFTHAENVLAMCLEANADYPTCQKAYDSIAIDLDFIEPMGHYIGARMVEIMNQFHPLEHIVMCTQSLHSFLPLYNQAAENAGAFVFNPAIVRQFSRIFQSEV